MKSTAVAIMAFTVLAHAGLAHAEPAQPGADRGAFCDWGGNVVPSGAPGTLYSWRGQNAPGVAQQNAARGVETFVPGTQIRISDDKVGAGGDVLRGFFFACNVPTPLP